MVAQLSDWFASQKAMSLPLDSGDADLFLDLDFTKGEAAIDAILVTAEGLTKYDDSVATWDSTLGVNPNGGLAYALNNYVPSAFASRAEIGNEITIYAEIERAALCATWLDDSSNFIDNSEGPSADCWDGSTVTAANHRYGDYTSATKTGYFYYVGGNGTGTPLIDLNYQVINSGGYPVGRMRAEHKYNTVAAHLAIRMHSDVISDSNIDPVFAKVVQTIDAENFYNLYIDGALVHRVKRTSSLQTDALFYYFRLFSNAGNTNNSPHGYVRKIQVAKRAVYNHFMKGPRVGFIGDSFVQRGANHSAPGAGTVAGVDAIQNGLTNAPIASTVSANDTPIIGTFPNPFIHGLRQMAALYGLRFPYYVCGDSGHGWSDTVGAGTSQIRSYFTDAMAAYDPEILVCMGSVNDVNASNPPTDLLAETKALLDAIVQSCRNTRRILFYQTLPGFKGDNVGDADYLAEYERQVALQEGIDGYEITNARGETVTVEFIETYEPLGGQSYNAQFSAGGAVEAALWDAVYTKTETNNDVHFAQYGMNRFVELAWPSFKNTVLSIPDL